MIHRYEQWSATGDPLVANDANVSIEPMQCDAGDPAKETINHLEPALEKLSGTLRNIHSASAIPIATLITPARYAKPVPIDGVRPSTASAQTNGPTTAAALDDRTIRLKTLRDGATIIETSSTIQQARTHDSVLLGPKRSTSRPIP